MNGIGIWMEYNEIELFLGFFWNEVCKGVIMKKFWELWRKFWVYIGYGLGMGIEFYEIEFFVVF